MFDDNLFTLRERIRVHTARLAREGQHVDRGHIIVERSVFRQVPEPLRRLDALGADVEARDLRAPFAGR